MKFKFARENQEMPLIPIPKTQFIHKVIDNVVIPMFFGILGFAFVLLITSIFIISK